MRGEYLLPVRSDVSGNVLDRIAPFLLPDANIEAGVDYIHPYESKRQFVRFQERKSIINHR